MIFRFFSFILGYGAGCLLTAELIAYKKSGTSIRTMGSGNPGMTNALRLYGFKWGMLTLAGDLLKTILACLLANWLFPLPDHLAILYAGLGTIFGHNFPFWNGGYGGKGVACTCMALFCFSPFYGLAACLIGLFTCLITQYLALGGMLIPASFFMIIFLTKQPLEICLLTLLILLLMLQRSFTSLKRIIKGQEERGLWTIRSK